MNERMISAEEFKAAIESDFTPVTNIEWRGIPIIVRKCLSFEDMMTFVNDIVSSCFAENTGEYLPEIKDFATRCHILESYADFVLPKDISEKYDLIYCSDIISVVVQQVEQNQFNAIMNAIDRKIDNNARSNIEALTIRMNELVSSISSLESKMSAVFDGVNEGSISKIAGAIVNGSFDESKLVKAFSSENSEENKVTQMPSAGK